MTTKITENELVNNLLKSREDDYIATLSKLFSYFETLSNNEFKELYYTSEIYNNKTMFGYIYILLNKKNGLTKIGKTRFLKNRMQTFIREYKNFTGEDSSFELVALLYSHDCVLGKLEKELHKQLENYNTHGEWFDLKNVNIEHYLPVDESVDVNGVMLMYSDAHDYHLYKDVMRYNSINTNDLHYLLEAIKCNNYSYKIKNPIVKIAQTCLLNKIGFSIDKHNVMQTAFIVNHSKNDLYDINRIKYETIDFMEIKNVIN